MSAEKKQMKEIETGPQNETNSETISISYIRIYLPTSSVIFTYRGISIIDVNPPKAAALVAVAKPSHAVRPGSLICT